MLLTTATTDPGAGRLAGQLAEMSVGVAGYSRCIDTRNGDTLVLRGDRGALTGYDHRFEPIVPGMGLYRDQQEQGEPKLL